MKSITRTRTIGGSIVVTIPKNIVKEESLKEGELVEIEVSKIKNNYFGALKEIDSFDKNDKFKSQFE